MVNEKV